MINMKAIAINHDQFPWLNITDKAGVDNVESAGLTGYHISTAGQLADAKRTNAVRVKGRHQPILLQEKKGKATMNLIKTSLKGGDESLSDILTDQVNQNLRIRIRLKYRPIILKLSTKGHRVS